MIATARAKALALALLLLASGCGLVSSSQRDEVQRELNRNRRLWQSHSVEDYRYVGRRLCYCGQEATGPVRVEVVDGEVVSLTYEEDGEPVVATFAGLWPGFEGVFDIVQDAIDRDAAEIVVEYHAEYGYPTSIGIDYMENAVDEELGYVVEDFLVVAP